MRPITFYKGAGWLKLFSICLLVFDTLGLESCANSVRIITDRTTLVEDVGMVSNGTAYINVDFSGLNGVSSQDLTAMNSTLGKSIAQALESTFRKTRAVSDVARVEPDSTDLVLLVRAQNPKYPKSWSDVSRGWVRVLLVGVMAEVYNIFALDFPAHRNNVALPLAALALPLYDFLVSYRYESMNGDYSLDYQLSILKPDGTLVSRQQFTDSAKVMVQADTKLSDLHFRDLINATATDVSGSVQNYVIADSTTIRNLGEEMKRSYPADCDRILSFKRNVYRVLDDSSVQINSGVGKSVRNPSDLR